MKKAFYSKVEKEDEAKQLASQLEQAMTKLKCPLKNANCTKKCMSFVDSQISEVNDGSEGSFKVSEPGCNNPMVTGRFIVVVDKGE